MSKTPKRPRDPNQLAKAIADLATREIADSPVQVDQAIMPLGRSGGLAGGHARAAKLTPEQRADIARRAAVKRWGKNGRSEDKGGG